jgi:DNA-binding transcriptional LysR family regulator
MSAPGTPLRTQWQQLFECAGVAPPRIPIESDSVVANREILRKSDFLTLLSPDQVAIELEAGWLTKICEAPRNMERTIGVTTRAAWRPTAMQQAFMDSLRGSASTEKLSKNL